MKTLLVEKPVWIRGEPGETIAFLRRRKDGLWDDLIVQNYVRQVVPLPVPAEPTAVFPTGNTVTLPAEQAPTSQVDFQPEKRKPGRPRKNPVAV